MCAACDTFNKIYPELPDNLDGEEVLTLCLNIMLAYLGNTTRIERKRLLAYLAVSFLAADDAPDCPIH